ncbi:high mobility group AT-hook 1a isoform X6 [Chiloscyllium punctatum]|uniref:high mobility group AT-hook 1a isoform X6 n=1 Tax=Chiloscyllium punctatum TaxID=137246 RepID=UPI003B63BD33
MSHQKEDAADPGSNPKNQLVLQLQNDHEEDQKEAKTKLLLNLVENLVVQEEQSPEVDPRNWKRWNRKRSMLHQNPQKKISKLARLALPHSTNGSCH